MRAGEDPRAQPARTSPRRPLRIGQRGSGKLPFGYRYITKDAGGGVARVEVAAEDARLESA